MSQGAALGLLGIEARTDGPGHGAAVMTVTDAMLNVHGSCHGGMIFTLADTALQMASNSHGPVTVAAAASIDFLAPVAAGAVLTATATERWKRGRTGIYAVDVHDQSGTLIATFHARSHTPHP